MIALTLLEFLLANLVMLTKFLGAKVLWQKDNVRRVLGHMVDRLLGSRLLGSNLLHMFLLGYLLRFFLKDNYSTKDLVLEIRAMTAARPATTVENLWHGTRRGCMPLP